MSPDSYSWEVRESAEELYIIDGMTYEQVAGSTGVSISQLKRWGLDSLPTWSERRREYRQAQTSVRRNVMLAKAKLIESVIDSEDPQKAYAFNALVGAGRLINEEARERNQAVETKEYAGSCEMPADMTGALADAIQRKIGLMLGAPGGITMGTIKELQQSLALLEKLQAKAGEGEDKDNRQLDSATIKTLREQFGL